MLVAFDWMEWRMSQSQHAIFIKLIFEHSKQLRNSTTEKNQIKS